MLRKVVATVGVLWLIAVAFLGVAYLESGSKAEPPVKLGDLTITYRAVPRDATYLYWILGLTVVALAIITVAAIWAPRGRGRAEQGVGDSVSAATAPRP